MSKILVNLEEALEKAGLPAERFQHNWIKKISGLDKKIDNGWSLKGDFIKKWDCKALQLPGLYLLHDRTREIPYRSEVFELLPDGSVSLIDHQEVKTEDWAVLLWESIEKWFARQKEIASQLQTIATSSHEDSPPEGVAVLGGELGAKLKAAREQQQKPLRHFVIKFGIQEHSKSPHKVRAAIISELPNETEMLHYLEAIASEFDVHRNQLPKVWKQGDWVYFHVEDPGDSQ
jgi:hypothetical protein